LAKFGFSVKDIEEENDILRVKNEEFSKTGKTYDTKADASADLTYLNFYARPVLACKSSSAV